MASKFFITNDSFGMTTRPPALTLFKTSADFLHLNKSMVLYRTVLSRSSTAPPFQMKLEKRPLIVIFVPFQYQNVIIEIYS
jgi:hypothetical protein